MSSEIAALGLRLRELREQHRLSLRDAGAAAGLSASFLSELERGESEIAITRLMRLADVYGVSVADLLADLEDRAPDPHVPLAECRRTTAGDDLVEILYPAASSRFVQPFRLVLSPGARHGDFVHASEEFHHCVQGRPRVIIAGESFDLRPGDTVYIAANQVHEWDNRSRPRAVLVGAVGRARGRGGADGPGFGSADVAERCG